MALSRVSVLKAHHSTSKARLAIDVTTGRMWLDGL